jgi:hypothetical protein
MIIRTLKIGKRYYTIEKSIVGFMNGASAQSYKNFLDRHRNMYGSFPSMIEPSYYKKATETGQIRIRSESLSQLQERCRGHGVGLIGVHYFDYTHDTIELQAEELNDELGLPGVDYRLVLEREYNGTGWSWDHGE